MRYNFAQIIGKSHQMEKIFDLIKDVAKTHSTILIQGESGTGKELIANAIHYNSLRRDRKMVPINCAVLSENLLESELFGHVRGAFTGAIRDKIGRFELANSGTIFLDEIGEVSPGIQVKLLRVLQSGEFERVGGTETIKVDVRVIAATNKNLEEAIKKGQFREDLYYRLNVIPIDVPPLRNRIEDIPLLVNHFIKKYVKEVGKNIAGITEEALGLLMQYHWPGNVRELENVIERSVVLSKNSVISGEDLSHLNISDDHKSTMQMLAFKTLPEVIRLIEKDIIIKTLRTCKGNKSVASKKLGIHRSTFLSKITKYEIID
jgi:transcriptional regulator with PAS, ATPase and Fis domain